MSDSLRTVRVMWLTVGGDILLDRNDTENYDTKK